MILDPDNECYNTLLVPFPLGQLLLFRVAGNTISVTWISTLPTSNGQRLAHICYYSCNYELSDTLKHIRDSLWGQNIKHLRDITHSSGQIRAAAITDVATPSPGGAHIHTLETVRASRLQIDVAKSNQQTDTHTCELLSSIIMYAIPHPKTTNVLSLSLTEVVTNNHHNIRVYVLVRRVFLILFNNIPITIGQRRKIEKKKRIILKNRIANYKLMSISDCTIIKATLFASRRPASIIYF